MLPGSMIHRPVASRVLLIAEACNPEWVSVPLVGWSHARAVSKLVDAHIVTQIRNRDALLRAGLREGQDFTAIDSEAVARPIYKLANLLRGGAGKGWTTATALSAISYPYFEKIVWKKFHDRFRSGEFDLVHRITPLSPTIPSPIAAKCRGIGVPFVLGPLDGGVPWPPGFDSARRREKEWLSYVRQMHRFMPGYLATRRSASAILIGSRDTWKQMPHSFRGKCFYLPENAIDPERFAAKRNHIAARPIRAVFVGRLVPYKGVDMLLEAATPLLASGAMTLDIIGDGPQREELDAMIKSRNLAGAVRMDGWIEHRQLQERLADADIMPFPSVREFGGGVVLEAMITGVIPIVIDYGGPGELASDATGFLVPIGNRASIIESFRRILTDLSLHPEKIDSRSKAAIARVERHFTWNAKAERVLRIYDWARDPGSPRPEFPMPIPDDV
jgi:glycosyltransferase involved in cell wall biosynthesis